MGGANISKERESQIRSILCGYEDKEKELEIIIEGAEKNYRIFEIYKKEFPWSKALNDKMEEFTWEQYSSLLIYYDNFLKQTT